MSVPKRALVTGASSGIGRSAAIRLVEAGWEVWGTSRDPGRLPVGERFHPVRLDVGNLAGLSAVLEAVWAEADGFSVVVNNAGSGLFGPLARVGQAEERYLFDVLYHGPMQLTRFALERMKSKGGGRIVQVTTIGVELPIPLMGTYSAAKAAFSAATRILRIESRGSPVALIEVRPGDIRTGFNRSVLKTEGSETPIGDKVWRKMEALMASAPDADVVGRRIAALAEEAKPPELVRVGSFFQTVIGPLGSRILPERQVERAIAEYYGI